MHDALIVGGGHNGLVCGLLLARAGLDVVVVEANDTAGGCIWTETLPSGHRLERGAIEHSSILSLADELGLASYGLSFIETDVRVGAGFSDGTSLLFHHDLEETLAGFDGPRAGDREGYRHLSRVGGGLFSLLDSFSGPPRLADIAALGMNLERDPFRMLVTSSQKLIGEFIDDPYLRSVIEMYGAHAQLPPWLPGSGMFAFLLPAGHGEPTARPRGGSVSLVDALAAGLGDAGGSIVTGEKVISLESTPNGARVRTASGLELIARTVVSSLDVNMTNSLLADASIAPDGRVSSGALNVAEMKVDLALSQPANPGFDGSPQALWMLQEGPQSLSRAFGQIVAGRLPEEAAMMWGSPSAVESTAAPEGQGTVWLSAFVPARIEGGWDEETELQAAEWLLDGYARITGEDLRTSALDMRVTGPGTWQSRIGSPYGNPNHIDLTLDQMFDWRPPLERPYRTSAPWLYLTGAGTFPGGGLSGLPGRNAAHAVLEDAGGPKKRRSRIREDISAIRTGWHLFREMRRGT